MWKFVSRGLRETFERRIAFSRKDKGSAQDCNSVCFQYKFIPGIVSSHTFDNGAANRGKNGPCDGKKQNNREQQRETWRDHCQIEQFSLFGLLGWSGAMLAGWYVFQPVCRRRHRLCHRPLPPDLDRLVTQTGFSGCHTNYVSLSKLFSHIAVAQPLGILPKKSARTVPRPVENLQPTNPFVPLLADEVDGPTTPAYGPKTAEQALDEAAANLEEAQKVVLREIENSIGMACLDLGKNQEALDHFQKAAELDYAPAVFNLGLCNEMGIGTTKDLRRAAKYYELASEKGHATAMYNLGVFHIRGWGGVPVDGNKARQLFVAAAKLGQANAKEALNMAASKQEQKTEVRKEETRIDKPDAIAVEEPKAGRIFFKTPPKKLDATQTFYQLLGIKTSDRNEEDPSLASHSVLQNRDLAPVPMVC
ncbi:hypothetical protein C0J52_13131 [Blattella germanica]|nr:hypothetical protein C0J52_13131 [Blattella germanica]